MCSLADLLTNYWNDTVSKLDDNDPLKAQTSVILKYNVQALNTLEEVCESRDSARVLKYVQVHDNTHAEWINENDSKSDLVDEGVARTELRGLRAVIEYTTACVVAALLDDSRLVNAEQLGNGGPHSGILRQLIETIRRLEPTRPRMLMHSSHLGLTPEFVYGALNKVTILAALEAFTRSPSERWHHYRFNVCLIKIINRPEDRDPRAEVLRLVTENNRSCFTHGISGMPPVLFALCESDLTANFRKFKEFERKSLANFAAAKRLLKPHSPVQDGTNLEAAKAGSRPAEALCRAYRATSEAEIRRIARQAPFIHACLEEKTTAAITVNGVTANVVVPPGLYEHGGVQTLDSFEELKRLWRGADAAQATSSTTHS